MIDSVRIRRQCSLDFYSHYEHLCAIQGCAPLASVKAKTPHGVLDLNADRIRAADWGPLLNAVRHNKTLTSIAIRSFHHQGHGDSGVERPGPHIRRRIPAIRSKDLTGHLCKAIKGCLMISSTLGNLELQGLLLREKDLILLTKGLANTSSLERLSLAYSPIGDGGLEIICQAVKNSACIKSIDFTGCNLTWRGAEHMASILKGCTHLNEHAKAVRSAIRGPALWPTSKRWQHQAMKRHGEAWAESLRYRRPDLDCMAGLRRITVNCNTLIGDQGAMILAECLGEDLWLKALDLQQCGITNEGAKSFLDAFKTNTTLVVLDIRKNPLVDHALMKKIIEKVLMNADGTNPEYKWLPSPSPKDVKNKPKKRTVVLGNGRKGKATIRIGFSSKKSLSPGKMISCDQDSCTAKALPPDTHGFLPWRTAERAKRRRASSGKKTHEFPLHIQAGIPVKVTVESASTSETETDGAIEDAVCKTDPPKATEIMNLKQCQQLQMDYEECKLRLKEERKARVTAEERIMELEVENSRLRNLNSSLSEVLHAQSVASTILEDEGVLGSIESSFQKFHAFLDLLKDAGLGQLAAMAGIDQSDFGLLHHPQMSSTLAKPAITQKEKSFEEERQEHMENFKNAGSAALPGPTYFQSNLGLSQSANNVLPVTTKVQELQAIGQPPQSLWKDIEGKIGSWKMEENASKIIQEEPSEKCGQPVKLEARDSSVRQPVTSQHSISDSSVNVCGGYSNKFSAPTSENSKVTSKRLPYTANFAARGDQSIHQSAPSRNDTIASDSEIRESIHSMASV
ncbi:centrosomal protein of 78 kDa isoform X1 [Varanus komodoensis]|uniref:centrosomal protein of 78 kDa isoform X1 n=1 Tax=Varanus komodoensis TaxID=61221 RepID=UPI001CF76975|nr:centrosomal protein of 78 kDa isoform X1 [Varanus komodoensis]XP_044302702.1 centrosomal protein of 78 kDa isoform X1 [Varanus komodoensis]